MIIQRENQGQYRVRLNLLCFADQLSMVIKRQKKEGLVPLLETKMLLGKELIAGINDRRIVEGTFILCDLF